VADRFVMGRHGLAAGVVRLELAGEVDMLVSAELTSMQLREIEDPVVAGLVVDLHQVTFLDSTGIAALVSGMRAAQRRGIPFTVTNPQRMVRSVLEVTGVLGALTGSDHGRPGTTGLP
jgi:anti-anti-sigma factor